MIYDDYQSQPEELEAKRDKFKIPPREPCATNDRINYLLGIKAENETDIAELVDSLRNKVRILEQVDKPKKKQSAFPKIPSFTSARGIFQSTAVKWMLLVMLGVAVGAAVCYLPSTVFPPTTVRPVTTETLEDFVTRESQTLTADERKKLIAVTENVLAGDYIRPSEIREKFRHERLKAKIDSPAFEAFSEKFAVKTDDAENSVEAMRSVYESLLRGLKVQAYNDFSSGLINDDPLPDVPVEVLFQCLPSNVTPLSTAGGEVPVSSVFSSEWRVASGKKNSSLNTRNTSLFRRR
jgi:hypothetical protein